MNFQCLTQVQVDLPAAAGNKNLNTNKFLVHEKKSHYRILALLVFKLEFGLLDGKRIQLILVLLIHFEFENTSK